MIEENNQNWKKNLEDIVYKYNTRRHRLTNLYPFLIFKNTLGHNLKVENKEKVFEKKEGYFINKTRSEYTDKQKNIVSK